MLDIIREFTRFALRRKKYVLLPLFFASILLGTLIVAAKGSVVAPFIYALF